MTRINNLALLVSLVAPAAHAAYELPDPAARKAIVQTMGAAMERLDGEALFVRANRHVDWRSTVARLADEAEAAATPAAFARTLKRLDLAYPNLHSYADLPAGLAAVLPGAVRPAVRFALEKSGASVPAYRVFRVSGETAAELGDEVLAVNGIAVAAIAAESFLFCKWPLKTQCDDEMPTTFESELLTWTRAEPLVYTLRRDGVVFDAEIEVAATPPRPARNPLDYECGTLAERYPGFVLAYTGNRACVFTSTTDPETAVLRILSFNYKYMREDQTIRSVEDEVDQLLPWWREHATWSHLVVDVIDNAGGQAPIPYYKMLFQNPFQEEYVRFKKTPELEQDGLRFEGIFWETDFQEQWFQSLRSSGAYDEIAYGDFLPPVPMFGTFDLFEPYAHPFRGRVSLLVNRFCVSSCDGFDYAMSEQLAGRIEVYGESQSADSAYGRLTLDLVPDAHEASGYRAVARVIRTEPVAEAVATQTIAATRSVDVRGVVYSGVPVPVTPIPYTWENLERWPELVLHRALMIPLFRP